MSNKSLLIIQEINENGRRNTLYAEAGRAEEWKERLGREPSASVYELTQIKLINERDVSSWQIENFSLFKVQNYAFAFANPVAYIPIDEKTRTLLENIAKESKIGKRR